jgi:hypothetical protein
MIILRSSLIPVVTLLLAMSVLLCMSLMLLTVIPTLPFFSRYNMIN